MQRKDDSALLRRYAENQSDEAFAELVARYLNLVYSVALRQVGQPHQAEEIAQAVFIILARKAPQLRHHEALSSWLFQTTRLTANNFLRGEIRRQRREQEAYMQSTLNETTDEPWPHIAPLLDSAVAGLGEKDRRVILLRFYEGRSLRDAGLALGASEAATEKRVSRAVEKLRAFFRKRGVVLSAAAIAAAASANSVSAAPAGLTTTISAIAAAKGATASASTLTLIKGALKVMAWSKVKTAAAAGVVVILLTGATLSVIVLHHKAHHLNEISQAEARVKSRQLVDETQGATIIDLKPFINTALTDSPGSPVGITANNLSQLPLGTNLYAGVPFDIEGTIQLMGKKFDDYGKTYPLEVENIPIGRRCARLHLFHGECAIPWEQSGMPVAKLVLHYASGASEELNLVAGQQAFDFWGPTWRYGNKETRTEIKPAPGTELAWVGTNPWVQRWVPQFKVRLYRTTFANPRPSEVITGCDYVSTMAEKTAPFLAGLTVE